MGRQVIIILGRDAVRQNSGGGVNYARAHARALLKLGYEPHLFYIASADAEAATELGVVHEVAATFRRFPRLMQAELRDLEFPFNRGRLLQRVERFAFALEPPVVFHGFALGADIAVEIATRLRAAGREATVIASAFTTRSHESRVRRRWASTQGLTHRINYRLQDMWMRGLIDPHERRALTMSDLVLVNYDSVEAILRESYGPARRLLKIPYASEVTLTGGDASLQEWPNPPVLASLQPGGAPLIVSVSRHDPRKGVDVLIAALVRLRELGVPYRACLVGPGVLRREHQELVSRLGLTGSVAVTGWVPEPREYMAAADVFVLPSLEEGSGSVSLIEAMELGRASVVSAVDGLPEDITDKENGLLVAAGDVEGLASAILLVLRDGDLRERLERGARRTFEQRFTASGFIEALGAVYAGLGFPADGL